MDITLTITIVGVAVTLFVGLIPYITWKQDKKEKLKEISDQQIEIQAQRDEIAKISATLSKLQDENTATEDQLKIAKRRAMPDNIWVIENVDEVLKAEVLKIIREAAAKGEDILIDNFGLDLESVMPWINNTLVHLREFDDVNFQINSLIVNPSSEFLKNIIDGESNITTVVVNTSLANARKLQDHKKLKKFKFVIREYSYFPIFHGFIVNNEHLFMGFTYFEDGKLIGGTEPYLHLKRGGQNPAKLTEHYFRFYKDWFDYYWSLSTEVVNVSK